MDFIDLPQLLSAKGTIRLPGSKSVSNRVLLLAALSDGVTEVHDLLESDDTSVMLEALRTLGVDLVSLGQNSWRITGCKGLFPVKETDLFLGNAGTAIRPLTAVLAFAGGRYRLSGVERMHERPIGDLVDALRDLGADIDYLDRENYPPLEIRPIAKQYMAKGQTGKRTVRVRGNVSSQFLTGLLLALPLTGIETLIEVTGDLISKPYVEITLATMARFGVNVSHDDWRHFTIPAGSHYLSPGTIYVEGDASSASYFLAAGMLGGGPVRVEGVGKDSIQGDVRLTEALQAMGAEISLGPNWIEAKAPADKKIRGITLDCNHIPDAAMTLAVTALFAEGPTTLSNIASWRVKETDRIAAMAAELTKLGVTAEAGADFIRITPPSSPSLLSPTSITTYDDHRIAMCFSLAAFATPIRIKDPNCVAKTFPEYFQHFSAITAPVPIIAIDGPSASGKGTIAARVATALGFDYLDSGALYRLTALVAQQAGIDFDDEDKLVDIATHLDVYFKDDEIYLDGEAVGDTIRSEPLSDAASRVAALPEVRKALLFRQRAFARAPGLVTDGRDMGSVVFPDATLKIFLTASVEARAQRRYNQLIEKGFPANISPVLLELKERDERDSKRSAAPLKQSAGAQFLDTTSLDINQAVEEVMVLWQKVLSEKSE